MAYLKTGKYAGENISSIPINYLEWLANSKGFSKIQKDAREEIYIRLNSNKKKPIKFW